ncbi:MAG: VWA domain-containing protein [Candidatus Tectomicrobia bacterium]|uniref:VWA domain-containing protein n=1 Tax=Tectimicrobiota bacterium TaxID=2528274 RepID=A0A933LPK6_UNCTE|nr:VWA domain-containing protein [Candidatus Tectomicrobia bacterium]
MGFLSPIYLWLLCLLGLVFILYAWRPRKPLVAVSALWLWSEISSPNEEVGTKQTFPRLKELFWPILALTSVILALSQPYLLLSGHKAQDIIFILDVSASMQTLEGGSSRFDVAKKEIVKIAKNHPEDARFMLIGAGAKPVLHQPFTTDMDLFQRRLSEVACFDTPGDLLSAISLAKNYYQSDKDGFIYLMSDFADKISYPYAYSEDNLILVPVGVSSKNVGISDFQVQREELGSDRFTISLLIKNYFNRSKSVPITYRLDGQVVDSEVIQLEANEAKRIFQPGVGWGQGSLQVDLDPEDDFPLDNKAYAFLTLPAKIPVLMVSTKNSLLDQALTLHPEIDFKRIAPQQAQQVNLSDYQVAIIDGETLSPLKGIPQVRLSPLRGEAERGRAKDLEESVNIEWDPTHPLMRDLNLEGVFLTEMHDLSLIKESKKVLWSEQGIFLTTEEGAGFRIVTLGFNPVGGNFPLSPSFPIFWHNVIKWLAGDSLESLPFYKTGRNYLSSGMAGKDPQQLAILTSTGAKLPLEGTGLSEYSINFNKAGWYQLRGKNFTKPLAVNFLSEEESDISPKPWPNNVGTSHVSSSRIWAESGHRRAPLYQVFLVLSLGAMFMEWFLRGRVNGPRRHGGTEN